ncbi:MAG TPA: transglutaminase-like domain-containing protein [Pseudomonadales bacterium]|nr:transglutaminase-like domain-containing protein [Pseudomonadales bacterium]
MADKPTLVERYLEDTDRDELAAALLVARTLEPNVDEGEVRTALGTLGDRCAARLSPDAAPQSLADFLRDEGFKASDNLQSLDASRIDKVLSSHRGIPITLSVPYLIIGRALGMTTQGINFPGHFLLSANGVLIDPLTADLLSSSDVERWLTDANLTHLGPNALAPASPDEMAVRMFNNVKAIYAARGDFVDALALIDVQMALVRDTGPLHLERAELWFRLGDAAAAASVLEGARRELVGTRWEAEIDKRLKRLAGQPPSTIH